MADLNKFLRSKDRITEILHHLTRISTKDEQTNHYIISLQKSLGIIDLKMEEFKKSGNQFDKLQA